MRRFATTWGEGKREGGTRNENRGGERGTGVLGDGGWREKGWGKGEGETGDRGKVGRELEGASERDEGNAQICHVIGEPLLMWLQHL